MEYRISKIKIVKYLMLTTLMVVAAFGCTQIPGSTARVIGWCGVAFFGLGFVVFPIQFMKSDPQMSINQLGIHDRREKGWGTIPWSEITRIRLGAIYGQKLLCIEVKDENVFLNRHSKLSSKFSQFIRKLGFTPISIGLSHLDQKPEAILEYIESQQKGLVHGNVA